MHFLCRNRPERTRYHQLSRWKLDCERGDDLHVRQPVFVRNFGRLLALPIVMQLLFSFHVGDSDHVLARGAFGSSSKIERLGVWLGA